MVAGSIYWKSDRQKRKEFDVVVAQQKAKEKNEAWIKELEARDEEDKSIKAQRAARRSGGGPFGGGSVANSMIDPKERRRMGVLDMVEERIFRKK